MHLKSSVSTIALLAASVSTTGIAQAQVVTGAPITISPSSANVLNLLAPYLNLNATSVGQTTLSTNLSQAISINNSASPALQSLGISDENLLGSGNGTTLRTQAQGFAANATFGVAANLGGGLPTQAAPAGSTVIPMQAVGGLGVVLGAAYANGVNKSTTTAGPLNAVATFLNNGYTNFTSVNLGVAKNYFANGGANNTATTVNGVTTNTTNPAVAPAGFTLPTANGLPNTTNSVYDIAAGVTNLQPNQDVFGSSRPDQVVAAQINSFDPTALNGLATNPSFPSGHATYAYTDSILLALLVPQEYQSMLYRGSAYANSRIVVGVHYPLDLIAARALAQYDLAQAFTNPLYINNANTTGTAVNLPANFTAAAAQITPYLTAASVAAGCGTTVAACAASAANTTNDPYVVNAANAATFTANLTYGLPTLTLAQAPREAAPAGGPDASILLAPVYGGDSAAARTLVPGVALDGSLATSTINQIIVNTETNALAAFYGTSLSYWTRIDLAAAAGYLSNITGTLSTTATDFITVPVTVGAGGVLDDNGIITNNATVTGTLSGSGIVAGTVTVNGGATLAPGALSAQAALQAGTPAVAGTRLVVGGAVTFAPTATFAISASPTQTTSLTVGGQASLGGAAVTVTLPTSGTFVTSQNNAILAAGGGIAGTFSGVTSNLLFATPTLAYGANNVLLSFGTPNFGVAATTRNQLAVANALTQGAAVNPNSAVVTGLEFFTTAQAAQGTAALSSLSGSGLTAAQNVAHRSSAEFTSSIFDQTTFFGANPGNVNSITLTDDFAARAQGFAPVRELADLPAARAIEPAPVERPRSFRVWATGFGGVENIGGNAGVGFGAENNSVVGGSAGIDYQFLPGTLVGVAAGGTAGNFNLPSLATSGSTNGGHVAGYGLASFGSYYGASSLSGSFFSNSSTRVVSAGAVGETDSGNFNSREIRLRVEGGRRFAGFGGAVTPFVALEIADLRSSGFSEFNRGGPTVLGLTVPGQDSASVPSFVGARFERATTLGNGLVLTPTLQVAYVHEFAPQRTQLASLAGLPQAVFLVDGARPSYNSAQVKAGAELAIGAHTSVFATFDGEFSGVAQFYGGKGGFKYVY